MDGSIKGRLKFPFRRKSKENSTSSSGALKSRAVGRRGALGPVHFKRANISKNFLPAVVSGDAEKVRGYLEEGVDLADLDEAQLAVRAACERGHVDVLGVLIRYGAPLNGLGGADTSPLHICANQGDTHTLSLLLANGANPNTTTRFEKRSATHYAALKGHEGALDVLSDSVSSADLNQRDIYGLTPLHLAVSCGHIPIIRAMVKSKRRVDVDVLDNDGWTPLHIACERGHQTAVRLLLEANCEVDTQNQHGRTPLHWACTRGHQTIIRVLVNEFGANTLIKDRQGRLPVACLPPDNSMAETVTLLKAAMAATPGSVPTNIGSHMSINPRQSFIEKGTGKSIESIRITNTANYQRKLEPLYDDVIHEGSQSGSNKDGNDGDDDDDDIDIDAVFKSHKKVAVDIHRSPLVISKKCSRTLRDKTDGSPSVKHSSPITRFRDATPKQSLLSPPVMISSSEASSAAASPYPHRHVIVSKSMEITTDFAIKDHPEETLTDEGGGDGEEHQHKVPEELKTTQNMFNKLTAYFHTQHSQVDESLRSLSIEVSRAARGRVTLTDTDIMQLSNKLNHLQDVLFEFSEEFDSTSRHVSVTLDAFVKQTQLYGNAVRPRISIWIYNAFFCAVAFHLVKFKDSWLQLLRSLDSSAEKLDDHTKCIRDNSCEEPLQRIFTVLYQVVCRDVSEDSVMRRTLEVVKKGHFKDNSATVIVQEFVAFVMRNDGDNAFEDKDLLFKLAYRLGTSGPDIVRHLGVAVDKMVFCDATNIPQEERNLRMLSLWREKTVLQTTTEHVQQLVEALILCGREDLVQLVLMTNKGQNNNNEATNPNELLKGFASFKGGILDYSNA